MRSRGQSTNTVKDKALMELTLRYRDVASDDLDIGNIIGGRASMRVETQLKS